MFRQITRLIEDHSRRPKLIRHQPLWTSWCRTTAASWYISRIARQVQLVRLSYFAESTSIRGGAKFLGDEKLAYSKKWNLKIHQPTTINERSACKDVDDFLRAADGSIDENAAHEPLLRYRSTQTRADVKFDRLSAMPCFVLDSLEQ